MLWFGIIVLFLFCDVSVVPKWINLPNKPCMLFVMGFSVYGYTRPHINLLQKDGHNVSLFSRELPSMNMSIGCKVRRNGLDEEVQRSSQRRKSSRLRKNHPTLKIELDFANDIKSIIFGFLVFTSIIFTPQSSLATEEVSADNAGSTSNYAMPKSRYWDMVASGEESQVRFANERLLDQAVGTIMTMYYDNSGGAKFNPKEMYDRWKVMRVYAKEGINGVKELTSAKDVSKSLSSDHNTDASEVLTRTRKDAFIPQMFVVDGNGVQVQKNHFFYEKDSVPKIAMPAAAFDSRDNTVQSLKWLVSTLDDPYSRYLTRDELDAELQVKNDGFLGLGAIVEAPSGANTSRKNLGVLNGFDSAKAQVQKQSSSFLTTTRASSLPLVTVSFIDDPVFLCITKLTHI